MARLPLCALLLAVALRSAAAATEHDVTPRLTFSYNAEERRCRSFSVGGVFNFTSLLLSKEDNALFVGARETLFALDLSDVGALKPQRALSWTTPDKKRGECSFKGKDLLTDCFNYIKILLRVNGTHLYVCGTFAFSPICAYVNTANFSLVRSHSGEIVTEDGRGRCPFNPDYRSTAIMADGELYAGTVSNFQGNEPVISRSLGQGSSLKTENSLNWLQDPAFVGSAYIRETLPEGGPMGDGDKIYFFFSEAGKEFDFFDNTVVSRIARVCKGDLGGERVLQKKWTTFLKAQLSCSLPDDGFPFNIVRDVFVLTPSPQEWKSTVFYGVFTSQWYNGASGTSAVCSFTMEQVEKAFSGRFREVNRETQQWSTYNHPVPEPRPGACITDAARKQGVLSSLHMPDKVLNFVKDHFLMDSVLRSQPLLLKRHARYTRIAVHQVAAAAAAAAREAYYRVLFIGTDDGRLHKAVSVKNKMHVIEEVLLFRRSQPVRHMQLDAEKGFLYVSTFSELVEVPLANCTNYLSCGECILSRDPYCAWNGRRCVRVTQAAPRDVLLQDVDNADASALCDETAAGPHTSSCQAVVIPPNTFQVLPCELRSKLARRSWVFSETSAHSRYLGSEGGLAVVAAAQPDGQETYECWSVEEGFWQLLANYCVRGQAQREDAGARTGWTRTPAASRDGDVVPPGHDGSPQIDAKTYWNELVVVCALLAFSLLVLALFVIYRNAGRGVKSVLKEGERPGTRHKKPAENLPLNSDAAAVPAPANHRGYRTLHDSRGSPPRERSSPEAGFSESGGMPPTQHSDDGPRPRVRLGSDIKDSVV
ncbi:semaphorin-4B-like [Syngnathus typhle]|uniref:semaphorin-4B-like n=1 Tax=Syngnathus typhle TaxID=161592 RepID=UPI002A6A7620|nr:semaphorin-4B-like [Syngnathus typhle]XP_061138389.1 semaphorin-4B-like [Syngnathus typhle]XP_061138391.1 semaphorin-4B-like [Syngnathus typhle]XP_061138392.1 semaphorin-4B-like [Syngnathus typhle]XP_061138393.1 semaphorin-4B-like [Syngnathus typhle]XP_061138394.1 semaphorin-4B-like [Syngnathus typhle]XP_061138395.1 semaphorin-4B-like [Syngnathus typhle]XP_061138396.1 semaphorin-4B-like [Syngnathus typhle]